MPADKRILGIEIKNPETGKYEKLNLAKTYYLTTNDFLAAGGDGYSMLGGAREEGPSMDVAFADYLAKTDLTAYAVVNPNSRTISISTAQYKKLLDQAANQVKPNETGEKELVPAVQTNTAQRTATIPVNVHKQFMPSSQKSLPETGTTDTTFISLFGFVVGLLGLSRFKKAHKE